MPTATLLSLPREIRDQILDLCLTTALPPPPADQTYTLHPLPSSAFIGSSAQRKSQTLFNLPLSPQTNSAGLLLTSRQIAAETRDALVQLSDHDRLKYVMRLRIEEEEGDCAGHGERYWVDWKVLPTRSWREAPRLAEAKAAVAGKREGMDGDDEHAQEHARQPVNLVVEIEKTMRMKPTTTPMLSEDQSRDRDQPEEDQQQQKQDQENEAPQPSSSSSPLRLDRFLHRHYNHSTDLPPPLALRSLLVAAEHGVLLLHWVLGDLVARAVMEGPCFASAPTRSSSQRIPPRPQTQPQPFPIPVPFNLTLCCCSQSARTAREEAPGPGPEEETQSPTQPLHTPLLEFLPFYLHSAKLRYTPFRALLSRGLLRGFALSTSDEDGRGEHTRGSGSSSDFGSSSFTNSLTTTLVRRESGRTARGTAQDARDWAWQTPVGQAACPVPEERKACCREGADGGLHWVCGVVRGVRDGSVE